jgi:hypothetical protein
MEMHRTTYRRKQNIPVHPSQRKYHQINFTWSMKHPMNRLYNIKQKKTRKWMKREQNVAEKARMHNKLKNIMPARCNANFEEGRRQAKSERKLQILFVFS